MKKFFALAMSLFLLAGLVLPVFATDDAVPLTGEVINVYNWGQYISDGTDGYIDVNAEFTRRTGIKVNYSTYDSNEALYSKLKTGGASYDIIIPSDYMVGKLIEEGLVQKLDYTNIPNYANIDSEFKGRTFDPTNDYSVPYAWGCVGLIYNSKYVTEEVTGWDLLWDNDYAGKILMFDNSRDAFAIAQLLLGIDVNTTSTQELDETAAKLSEQKPLVQIYVMDQVFSQMETEEAWIAPYYAGDFLTMQAENEDLAFCFPEEGFNLFIDSICIPTGAQNKTAAEQYINFLCDPEISGQNMEYLGYSTPISAAKAFMDPEVAENPIAYPPEEVLTRGVTFETLPSETTQYTNELFDTVKTSSSGWSWYILIILAVVVAAVIIFFVVRKKKRTDY
ncbi:MAG TPA: spermidine/putrescine ABC transporter substrate-binding protein [Oscillospiraceae bacterium]|mgnify:CR=1 FL=1|nr:spermidine/putrescine ABC transporter substrate-binding protein [Oscillospiraceae bacterium]HPK36407.1 spermidine/putrescine ABC transporter substrate-binding protein [Oscillospiraceae bacterium]HPR76531.1 spermidine/putrescine ABC transporter substrate-binding protein [Oscillospiraceae bacterium]